MKKIIFGFGLIFFIIGCEENRQSFYIWFHQAPTKYPECLVKPDKSGAFISVGILDIALTSGYWFSPLMENQLMPSSDTKNVRIERHGIQVEGAWVSIHEEFATGKLLADKFFYPTTTFIPAGDQAFGTCHVNIIREDIAEKIKEEIREGEETRKRVVVGIKMVGITTGGREIETPEYFYPVEICYGCLVYFPNGVDSNEIEGPDCAGTPIEKPKIPCRYGQNEMVACNICPPGCRDEKGDPCHPAPCQQDEDCLTTNRGTCKHGMCEKC
jgi:hypothetical protein